MDNKQSFLEEIKGAFGCGEKDIRTYSPLTLAYIGDDVFDIIIRTLVVEKANRPANELHKMTVKYVKAQTQAGMAEALLACENFLSDEEVDVYKRGRNAKSYTSAKNASIQDYRRATGFEALLGYVYLQGKQSRVVEIVKKAIELMDMEF